MAITPSLLTKMYINKEFPKYTDAGRCSSDIENILKIYDGLQPFKRECVVDGHLFDMINLEGTIPVVYKGARYDIPLRIMLPEDYPYSAPIIYIQPTGDMKLSKNITYLNDRGKVSIPYLEDWRDKNHPDLYKVLLKLCDLFGENPPVWTKKTDTVVRAFEDHIRRLNQERGSNTAVHEYLQTHNSYAAMVRKKPPKAINRQTSSQADSPSSPPYHDQDANTLPSLPPLSSHDLIEQGFYLPMQGEFVPSPDEVYQSTKNMSNRGHNVMDAEGGASGGKVSAKTSDSNVLKSYSCRDRIGIGGFAKVYLYEHKTTKRKVACKIVDLGINDASVQKYSDALKNEVKLLSTLEHMFIVTYISIEEHDNKLAMVMEYFPKGSLYSVFEKTSEGHFDEPRTRVYTWQILQGLIYLHENRVIHKDIKARNILVGEQDIIKIADFGISKKMEDLVTKTMAKTDNHGSIYWQSPEVLNGIRYGRKTDVWSLGCTVVEMLYGKPPLCSDNLILAAATAKIANCDVHPPEGCSEIAKEFLEFCFRPEKERLTAKDLMAKTDFPVLSRDQLQI